MASKFQFGKITGGGITGGESVFILADTLIRDIKDGPPEDKDKFVKEFIILKYRKSAGDIQEAEYTSRMMGITKALETPQSKVINVNEVVLEEHNVCIAFAGLQAYRHRVLAQLKRRHEFPLKSLEELNVLVCEAIRTVRQRYCSLIQVCQLPEAEKKRYIDFVHEDSERVLGRIIIASSQKNGTETRLYEVFPSPGAENGVVMNEDSNFVIGPGSEFARPLMEEKLTYMEYLASFNTLKRVVMDSLKTAFESQKGFYGYRFYFIGPKAQGYIVTKDGNLKFDADINEVFPSLPLLELLEIHANVLSSITSSFIQPK